MRLLNVGSGGGRQVPRIFAGWGQDTLDIDPNCKPDIVCDARWLSTVKARYDAVYCSHNIEHYYKHEVRDVLTGMLRVLKPNGFAHLTCPDINAVFAAVKGRDIDETWYKAAGGPISFHDVIYGWGAQVAQGNLYYAHKTAFTERSLGKALRAAGFSKVFVASDGAGNLSSFAFKGTPTRDKLKRLGL